VTGYSTPAIWLTIGLVALGTLALRGSVLALIGKVERIPPPLQRALRFIPPAVLAALAAQALVLENGAVDLTAGNPRLLAGLAAGVVAWKTKSVVWTITAGMAFLWLLERM
jgi:branched-subunit amino acid transport protein